MLMGKFSRCCFRKPTMSLHYITTTGCWHEACAVSLFNHIMTMTPDPADFPRATCFVYGVFVMPVMALCFHVV